MPGLTRIASFGIHVDHGRKLADVRVFRHDGERETIEIYRVPQHAIRGIGAWWGHTDREASPADPALREEVRRAAATEFARLAGTRRLTGRRGRRGW